MKVRTILSDKFQDKNERKTRNRYKQSSYNDIDIDKLIVTDGKLNDEDRCGISNNEENGIVVCNQEYLFNDDNSQSLLIPTKKEYFVCEICNHTSKQISSLQAHMMQHTADKPLFTCQLCHLKFNQNASLNFHMKKKHSDEVQERTYKCCSCNFSTDRKSNLKTHLNQCKAHINEVRFRCNICNRKFKQQSCLQVHQRIHNNEKQFTCPLCQTHFSQKANLNVHIRKSHIVEDLFCLQNNLFKCMVCNFSNTSKGNLKTHMRIHSGEKPFECKLCARKFAQLCHLQVHNRRHTGEKPFGCKFCSKKFAQKSNLIAHMKSTKFWF